jgi:hypothetical protein
VLTTACLYVNVQLLDEIRNYLELNQVGATSSAVPGIS